VKLHKHTLRIASASIYFGKRQPENFSIDSRRKEEFKVEIIVGEVQV
jgi:hypothetical protein